MTNRYFVISINFKMYDWESQYKQNPDKMNKFFHSLDTSLHQIFTLEAKKTQIIMQMHCTFRVNILELFAEWLQKCQEIWFAVSKPQSEENAVGSCKPKKQVMQ